MADLTRLNVMPEQRLVELFTETLNEYVEKFRKEVRGIEARWNADVSGNGFYMDYSAIRPTYTKADAKKALSIFNEYAIIITTYCEILNFKYGAIEWETDKTCVSSARIGKSLWVDNLPFTLTGGLE